MSSSDPVSTPPPRIVLDDSIPGVRVGDAWEQILDAEGAYNLTMSRLKATREGAPHNYVSVAFRGTELRVVGRATRNLRMNYTIQRDPGGDDEQDPQTFPAQVNISANAVPRDGLVPFTWRLDKIEPSWGNQFSISPYEGEMELDYVAYTPADTQARRNDVVLLDDNHPYIEYQNDPDSGRGGTVVKNSTAFGGTWKKLNVSGASFSTRFRGTRPSVYGAFNHAEGGLTVSYSIHGGSSWYHTITHVYSTHTVDDTEWKPQLLYENPSLSDDKEKDYRLKVTVIECTGNQALYFDFLTYEAVDEVQSTTQVEVNIPGPPANINRPIVEWWKIVPAVIGSIIGGSIFFLIALWVYKRVGLQRQKRAAARAGVPYQDPHSYALQVIAQRRREEALRRDEEDALPPWSPPQDPSDTIPPPEFDPLTPASGPSPIQNAPSPSPSPLPHGSNPTPESPSGRAAPSVATDTALPAADSTGSRRSADGEENHSHIVGGKLPGNPPGYTP